MLNATSFLADHPGGKKAIMIYAGKDATEEFNMMHEKEVVVKYAPEVFHPLILDYHWYIETMRHFNKKLRIQSVFFKILYYSLRSG